jgi:hypothetical protein
VNWIQGIPEGFWWWVSAGSLGAMVLSLVILRLVILRLPIGYFLPGQTPKRALDSWSPHWRMLGLLLKNCGGGLVILLGVVMLFTPGQGLLTILMGVCLVDFPGKRKVEVLLIRRPSVHRSLNWIRHRKGVSPLEIP